MFDILEPEEKNVLKNRCLVTTENDLAKHDSSYAKECAAKAKKAMAGHNRELALAWIMKAQR